MSTSIFILIISVIVFAYLLIDRARIMRFIAKIIRFIARIMRFIDRALSGSSYKQIGLLATLVVLIFVALLAARWLVAGACTFDIWDSLLHFLNPGNFFPDKENPESKLWALLIGFFGLLLLSGLLIPVFNNILIGRMEKVKNGQVYYSFSNHIVIIGYDKMTIDIIKQLEPDYPQSQIVILTSQPVREVRHLLFTGMDKKTENRITLISGSRNNNEDLAKLHILQSKELFILGEQGEYDRDSLNVECMKLVADLCKDANSGKEPKSPLRKCHILFEYQSTHALFQRQNLDANTFPDIDIIPFNFDEMWARRVFVGGEYRGEKSYQPLDREVIGPDSDKYVHLVIVGATRIGVAMAIEAAHLAHYANYKKQKTQITIIDAQAKTQMDIMRSRYPAFLEAIEVYLNGVKTEWSGGLSFIRMSLFFVEGRIESQEIRTKLIHWAQDPQQILTLAVCFDNPPASLAAGLYLPDEIYAAEIPVLIHTETSSNILDALKTDSKYRNVYGFGMTDKCYDKNLVDDDIPLYMNYIYDNRYKSIFDMELPTLKDVYVELSENKKSVHKWSNRYNADAIPVKLRTAGFTIHNYKDIKERDKISKWNWNNYDALEEILAKMEHHRWCVERLIAGYRYLYPQRKESVMIKTEEETLRQDIRLLDELRTRYMETYRNHCPDGDLLQRIDAANKKIQSFFYHDCLVPYEELNEYNKEIDKIFIRGIKWLISKYPPDNHSS
jgi:hypothetical protein